MADWDQDSTALSNNLNRLLDEIDLLSQSRRDVSISLACHWQNTLMSGLFVPVGIKAGHFRGDTTIPVLKNYEVVILGNRGVRAAKVQAELNIFQDKLQLAVSQLDAAISLHQTLTENEINAVLTLCAWVHAEWIRIHPFPKGNGRTARLWANFIARRYGLPTFVTLRPRPKGDYESAGVAAMKKGDWHPTVNAFKRPLHNYRATMDLSRAVVVQRSLQGNV